MNCIYEHNRINLIQRTILPIIDILQYLVCYIGNEALRTLKTVDFLYLLGYLPCSKTSGIHTDNLLVDFRYVFLMLFHNLRLKGTVSVLGNIYLKFAIWTPDILFLGSIAVVISRFTTFTALITSIAQMLVHFGFHHGLDGASKQILQCCLNIIGGFDIVLIDKGCDDVLFVFVERFYLVNFFFLCHKNSLLW